MNLIYPMLNEKLIKVISNKLRTRPTFFFFFGKSTRPTWLDYLWIKFDFQNINLLKGLMWPDSSEVLGFQVINLSPNQNNFWPDPNQNLERPTLNCYFFKFMYCDNNVSIQGVVKHRLSRTTRLISRI